MRRALLALALLPLAAAAMPALELASAAQLARAGACMAHTVDPDGSALYQAMAGKSGLDGSLRRYTLARDAAGLPVAGAAPDWDAAALLDARDPALRALFTGQRDGARLRTVAFDWASLDQDGQALLAAGAPDGDGAVRLAYLRGARELESAGRGARLRPRASLLGAAVAGAPLWVGAPAPALADPAYSVFAAMYGSRPAVVYLQANDGMLHAFDAAGGAELFAYLPLALRPQWPRLTSATHAASPYAEGGLAAGEALVRGAWKTVLAGVMGSGAQGVFALDVSDPARFDKGDGALFEFTDADDADMGNAFNAPALARLRIGQAQYGDFIVVASGYNNQRGDGKGRSNPEGPGALFLLSLDKDPDAPWQRDRNYYKFILPAEDASAANGLAQPALVPDADGSLRLAYAGDLQGRLWRLDFSGGPPSWSQARRAGSPLFAASDADGAPQPITSAPRAMYRDDGLMLLFGTGRLLEADDVRDRSPQTIYSVLDVPGDATITRAALAARGVVADQGGAYRLSGRAPAPAGWLLDLPRAGERVLASPLLDDGMATFATMVPGATACEASGSLYLLDAQNGLAPSGVAAPWLATPARPGRTPAVVAERKPGPPDHAGGRIIETRSAAIVGSGGRTVLSFVRKSRAGRLGWREVLNWEGMRNAAAGK